MAEKGKSVEEETGQEGWKRGSVAKKGSRWQKTGGFNFADFQILSGCLQM